MKSLTVILHNIRSTYNVGAILRTCDGLGVTRVIFSGYTPYPGKGLPHEQKKLRQAIHKTALGAENLVPSEFVPDLPAFIEQNRHHLHFLALEQAANSTSLADFYVDPELSYALILGEEVHGIPPEIHALAEETLEIPMSGQKESLNVSVATGIALWQLTRANS